MIWTAIYNKKGFVL